MKTHLILYFAALIIGSLIGLFRWRKVEVSARWLTILLFYTLFSELVKLNEGVFGVLENTLSSIYASVSVLVYGMVYLAIIRNPLTKRIVKIVILCFTFFQIGWICYNGGVESFPSVGVSLSILFTVTLSLLSMFELLNTESSIPTYKNSLIILNSAVLVYWSVSFTYLALYELIHRNAAAYKFTGTLHSWASVTYYFILAYSLVLTNRKEVAAI